MHSSFLSQFLQPFMNPLTQTFSESYEEVRLVQHVNPRQLQLPQHARDAVEHMHGHVALTLQVKRSD